VVNINARLYRSPISATFSMHITAEQMDQALASVNKKYTIDGGHFEIARDKHHEGTLKVFKEDFFMSEPICRSLEMDWTDAMDAYVMDKIKENMSLIAVDDVTGEIMGIRITAMSKKDEEPFDPSMTQDVKTIKAFTFLKYCNEKTDFFNRYGVSEAIEFVAVAVVGKYRKLGLGTKLMAGAVDVFRYLNLENMYVKSIGTSNFSQKIFEKVGFETVWQVAYEDYVVDGEVVLNNTGVHKTAVAYVIKI